MRKTSTRASCLAIAIALLCVVPVSGAFAGELEPSGKAIMDEWDARNQLVDEVTEGVTHVYKKFRMLGRNVNMDEKRRTTTWTRRYGKNNLASVLRYHSPEDLKDLSVLSFKDTGYASKYVVWQWDPEKKPRGQLKQMVGPLSLDSKTNSFAGTDFTFEDLEPEDLDSCVYRHVKDEKLKHPHDPSLSGTDCYVVEAYKKPGFGKTGYAKRVLWIDKKRYIAIKGTFYDRRTGDLIKTLWSWKLNEIQPKIWRADASEMRWHNGKTWTRMTVSKRTPNPGIPRWFFQPQILKITDEEGGKLIREMWGVWHRVEKLRAEKEALAKELAALKGAKK
jgi:hypothetical protein